VYLEGEAFFNVVKDTNRPFIVRTNEMSTTALGTSFNVSAYSVENRHKVSLLTGRVVVENTSIKGEKESEVLLPGEQIIYSRDNNDFHKVAFDLELETAWSNGIIMFEDTNFKSVILTLERWYGVQFEIINESKKSEDAFSGIFENQSLERVLEILSFSGGFTFKSSDNQIVIEFINEK
jgi:ferric-dicitrate binding protein FerR (iron transport regulator)